jgi:hypothetical protein
MDDLEQYPNSEEELHKLLNIITKFSKSIQINFTICKGNLVQYEGH